MNALIITLFLFFLCVIGFFGGRMVSYKIQQTTAAPTTTQTETTIVTTTTTPPYTTPFAMLYADF